MDPTVKDPLESTLAELGRERVTRRITLSGLDRPDVASFIERAAGMAPPPEIVAAIHAETEGNPLFVGEFVRLLAAENRLEQLDEVAPSLGIPAGAREVIARRLREPVGAVPGGAGARLRARPRVRPRGARARSADLSRDDLLRILDEAIEERVVSDIPGATGRLRFSHALIRDALYEGLPTGRRMRLHVQAGEALEALCAREPDAALAELAHHFFAAAPAGSGDKAVDYARRAGDHAAGQLAYEEAARLYEMALTLIVDDRARCGLLVALGDAQARAGDTAASKAHLPCGRGTGGRAGALRAARPCRAGLRRQDRVGGLQRRRVFAAAARAGARRARRRGQPACAPGSSCGWAAARFATPGFLRSRRPEPPERPSRWPAGSAIRRHWPGRWPATSPRTIRRRSRTSRWSSRPS